MDFRRAWAWIHPFVELGLRLESICLIGLELGLIYLLNLFYWARAWAHLLVEFELGWVE